MTNDQLKTVGEGITEIAQSLTKILGVARTLVETGDPAASVIAHHSEIILKANEMLLVRMKEFLVDNG